MATVSEGCTNPLFQSDPQRNLTLLVFTERSFAEACALIMRENIPNCSGGGRSAFIVRRSDVLRFQGIDYTERLMMNSRCGEC